MGFFGDLKQDLSQAVNELLPDDGKNETPNGAEPEETPSPSDISLGDMLDHIDAFTLTEEESGNADSLTAEDGVQGELFHSSGMDGVDLESMLDEISKNEELSGETEAGTEDVPAETEVVPTEETADEETLLKELFADTAPAEAEEEQIPDETPGEESIFPEEDTSEETLIIQEEPEADGENTVEEAIIEETEAEESYQGYQEENERNEEKEGESIMDSFVESRQALDETSVITAGMSITGDITSQGSIDIVGEVSGNIKILGKLNVTGCVIGNSQAGEVFAEGAKITGDIQSDGSVKVGASTVIIGNLTATSAAIAGAVKGDIDVRGPVVLDASAIVMGNIKSKSVQINNGAVIEGMCSQCYADVSPTTFFDGYKEETKKTKSSK